MTGGRPHRFDGGTRVPAAADASSGVGTGPAAGVAFVVCTYNRRPLVQRLVEGLLSQLPVPYPVAIVVIDNNSHDDTAEWARELAGRHTEVCYQLEPRQGLSHARNAGARASPYEYLLYLDDDAVVPPHFVSVVGGMLAEHEPDLFGGPIFPDYVDPRPAWFPQELEIRRKVDVSGFADDITLSGGNLGVRRSVLRRLGGFDPDYGMTGGRVGMLEERLLVEAYRRVTPPREQRLYYCVEAYVRHRTARSRMRFGFQWRRIYKANYQYMQYCLRDGVRRPFLLAGILARRLRQRVVRSVAAVPRLWRERRERPEAPMLAVVAVCYRLADLLAAIAFLVTEHRRVRRDRIDATPEHRPLHVLWLSTSDLDSPAPGLDEVGRDLETACELAGEGMVLNVVSIRGQRSNEIRRTVLGTNIRWWDAVVTDSPLCVDVLADVRAAHPHLQVVLRVGRPGFVSYIEDIRARRPSLRGVPGHVRELGRRLARARRCYARADQVVFSAPWQARGWFRLATARRRCAVVPWVPLGPLVSTDSGQRVVVVPIWHGDTPLGRRLGRAVARLAAAVRADTGWTMVIVGDLRLPAWATASVEVRPAAAYVEAIGVASAVLIVASQRPGIVPSLLDGLASRRHVIVTEKLSARLPQAIRDVCAVYDPRGPAALGDALRRCEQPFDGARVERVLAGLRGEVERGWTRVLQEGLVWAPRRSCPDGADDPRLRET